MWQWKLGGCECVCVRGECGSGNWVDVRVCVRGECGSGNWVDVSVCVGGVNVAVETGWM